MDSADLGRNTLYRCHANFTKAVDACKALERNDKTEFGSHVHDDIARARVESEAPRPMLLVPNKGPLHAWDIKFRHGYTTFRDLDLGEALGKGAFAEVRVATNRTTGARFAVKLAPHKPGHVANTYDPDDEADMICDEARVLLCLCHSSVLHCYDVVVHPDKCFLVVELMEGGELFDRIVNKANHHYTETEARRAAYVLLNAVAYLAAQGVVHRDLKPENLLLETSANDHDFKIADFGLAALLADAPRRALHDYAGTPGYVAPEVYDARDARDGDGFGGYGVAADVWSCGAIIYTLLGGYLPWSARDEERMAANIRHQDVEFHEGYWDNVSGEAKALIRALLARDPNTRETAAAALADPWFAMDSTVLDYNKLHATHDTFSASHAHVKATGKSSRHFGHHVHDAIELTKRTARAAAVVRDIPDDVELSLVLPQIDPTAPESPKKTNAATVAAAVFGCCKVAVSGAATVVYDKMQEFQDTR